MLAVSKHTKNAAGHYKMIFYEKNRFFEVDNMSTAIVYSSVTKNRIMSMIHNIL